ncbi:MAG: amidophosphoribosyltransferase [Rickettsiales bacterium]|nr:amidophosphoribosyltransferase [Rickettsiales bacterium]OUV53788.1 MAG: amidophosphoribosyltransferase [Rickettsiales bacterium TMED127]|tara:strand:- start:7130 stop:8593 length:1464 start_codon:yes stop_codon:yes gene_type:complete
MTQILFDLKKPKDECAVFGVFNNKSASSLTVLGLHALQHRGQDSTGIVSYDYNKFYAHRGIGQVSEVFEDSEIISKLKGNTAIGHNRYGTTGESALKNVQPLFSELSIGGISIAHNGNLTNTATLKKKLIETGSIFQSTSDTEVILHLISTAKGNLIDRLNYALQSISGAYSLLILTEKNLIGIRDPFGIRPLVLGKLNDSFILSSESCGLDIIGAELIRDVKAGEMIVIDNNGFKSFFPFKTSRLRPCLFEYIYFSRPDSFLEGRSVYQVRKKIGQELAKESLEDKNNIDIVVPIPDSGNASALGYSEVIKKPFEFGIIRNHYTGRTFIEATSSIRNLSVKLKHNPNYQPLSGKNVALIDDSIVRGTTSVKIVEMLRNCGVKKIHMRIASPPVKYPCYYGIDTPSKDELLAHKYSVEEIAKIIKVDSLKFVSLDGVYRALGFKNGRDPSEPQFTDHYFSGDYPVKLVDKNIGHEPSQLSLLIEAKR